MYAFAGASATATAAACANRLPEPMTNVSKVYFGFSRLGSVSRRLCGWPAPGRTGSSKMSALPDDDLALCSSSERRPLGSETTSPSRLA